jgi:hypothetical protein
MKMKETLLVKYKEKKGNQQNKNEQETTPNVFAILS